MAPITRADMHRILAAKAEQIRQEVAAERAARPGRHRSRAPRIPGGPDDEHRLTAADYGLTTRH